MSTNDSMSDIGKTSIESHSKERTYQFYLNPRSYYFTHTENIWFIFEVRSPQREVAVRSAATDTQRLFLSHSWSDFTIPLEKFGPQR